MDNPDKNTISNLRKGLTTMIADTKRMAEARPTYGAELVLAQRHLEDARMRLGTALAMTRGEDPFAYKQEGEVASD